MSSFSWDPIREYENMCKHGIDFCFAEKAFSDPRRKIFIDKFHSGREDRYFCIGKIGNEVVTVRFTVREGKIRIFGAGLWRKGKKIYEKKE